MTTAAMGAMAGAAAMSAAHHPQYHHGYQASPYMYHGKYKRHKFKGYKQPKYGMKFKRAKFGKYKRW